MDPRFIHHNSHLLDQGKHFQATDPHLVELSKQTYVYQAPIIDELPDNVAGIYTLGGGRQIGKTTAMKQWMLKLLKGGCLPESIAFFTGELITDQNSLVELLRQQIDTMPHETMRYIIIDEVTYIDGWAKGIKFLADSGLFQNTQVMLSGSDAVSLKEEAIIYLAGRRGKAKNVDYHLYSLSFREYLDLTDQLPAPEVLHQKDVSAVLPQLYRAFDQYLIHGGYLTAINEYCQSKTISSATLRTYADWIRGDVLKRGKQEHYLREVIGAILKRYNTQVSWNALAQDLSIDHPSTIADYIALLGAMDAVYVQYALREDKLTAAPKKARKLMFTDPFIYHAMNEWLNPSLDPLKDRVLPTINEPSRCSHLVESTVVTHYRRYFPTYYIKADGEVDVAYINKKRFWPVEIKWTTQLRSKDLKQITKYNNAFIYAKTDMLTDIMGVPVMPLPLALIDIG